MPPPFTHILLLLFPTPFLLYLLLQGQPGHQAAAAGWVFGLLILGGLWLAHAILSSVLVRLLHRERPLTHGRIAVMHLASISLLAGFLALLGGLL